MERFSRPLATRRCSVATVVEAVLFGALALVSAAPSAAQNAQPAWSDREQPIVKQLQGLRQLPDDTRAQMTKQLAIDIGQLPPSPNKLRLALSLANLSTEGDFGHDTLQEVASTLAEALGEQPMTELGTSQAIEYAELAQLVRYEHVKVQVGSPQFAFAMSKLEAEDQRRQQADFTLKDLQGKKWSLKALRGKVVLVNFWATWCPPCRKEMPDLEKLYNRFQDQGLVILAISDETASKVKPFVADRNVTYLSLLDPGRKVNALFAV